MALFYFLFIKERQEKGRSERGRKKQKGGQEEGLAFCFSKTGNNGATPREQAKVFLSVTISP